MPRPVVPIFFCPALLARGFTGYIQCSVGWQNQRAGLTDTQTRTHLHPRLLQTFDLLEQLGGGQYDAITDIALDART